MRRGLGDWQTPQALAAEVVALLRRRGVSFGRVLEPTCGTGAFIEAALPFADEVVGLEVQHDHVDVARRRFGGCDRVAVRAADVFATDVAQIAWRTRGPLLILGNPPWVTNAELSRLASTNAPPKTRQAGLSGLDAITGAANFDIAEAIVTKCLAETADDDRTLAVLLKSAVARKVLERIHANGWPLRCASVHRFCARTTFGAAVDACLLVAHVAGCRAGHPTADTPPRSGRVQVPDYPSLAATEPTRVMGFVGPQLVADIDAYHAAASVDGSSPIEWRHGVKHDAAKVMELTRSDRGWRNGYGEQVDVETQYLFPYLKCTDLARDRAPHRRIIVTQRKLTDDTDNIHHTAPKLWAYLEHHAARFDARKSRIYAGRSRFAMFGVGDYTFTDWKIAVSGMHPDGAFRLVGPLDCQPVLVDSTCYLLPCSSEHAAREAHAALTTPLARDLLRALVFDDNKRPISKRVLQRIDLNAVVATA